MIAFPEVIAGITLILLFVRVLVVLDAEFHRDEGCIKQPLASAVATTLTYAKFRDSEWRAFAALWTAMRFRQFFDRFRFILDPTHGVVCLFVVMAMLIGTYVLGRVEAWSNDAMTLIASAASIVNLTWILVIEHGKRLKKAFERLKVQ